jgi:3-ketosteroid 9alpha-monooxygenase subunit A
MQGRFPFSKAMPYGWYQMCYSDELAPAAVFPLRYFGRDLVVWRDGAGVAHVQDAYCPHLGAHLGHGGFVTAPGGLQRAPAEDQPIAERMVLQCPFHGWQFDGAGTCAKVPYSERGNKKAKLRTYPVVERNGLVMAWYHPHSIDPLWDIIEVPEYTDDTYTDYYRERWKIRTSPQEMAENSVDIAHFRYVHGTVTVPEGFSVEEDGPFMQVKTHQKFDTPLGPTDGYILSRAWGFGFSTVHFSGIVDTCLVACAAPIDDEYVDLRFSFMFKKLGDPDSEAGAKLNTNVGEALIADIRRQIEEDRVIWENKVYIDTPALVAEDGPFMRFRKWARQFYTDDWDRDLHREGV